MADYKADLKTQEAESLYVRSSFKSSIPQNKERTDNLRCARNSLRNVESRCFHQVCRITQVRSSPLQVLRSSLNHPRILIILSLEPANTTLSPPNVPVQISCSWHTKYTSPPKNSDTSCSDLPIPRIQWTATPVHCTNHVPRGLKNQSL